MNSGQAYPALRPRSQPATHAAAAPGRPAPSGPRCVLPGPASVPAAASTAGPLSRTRCRVNGALPPALGVSSGCV
eukprot:6348564-Heterocapsa_arctica.AAC.1